MALLLVAGTSANRIAVLNSDIFYLPALFRDIREGTPLWWSLPPGPYFFPDWLLYALSGGFAAPLGVTFAVYGILLALLYLGGCAFLARTLGAPASRGVWVAALVIALATSTNSATATGWFLPTLHGGLASLLPWMLAWLLRLPERSSFPRSFLGLVSLATVVTLSDPLTLPQFLLPAAAVLAWSGRRTMAGVMVLVPIVGSIALRLLLLAGLGWVVPPGFALTDLHQKLFRLSYWSMFFRGLAQFASEQPVLLAVGMGSLLVAYRTGRQHHELSARRPRELVFFLLFLLLSISAVVAAGGLYSDSGNNRYFLPLLLLPPTALLLTLRPWQHVAISAAAMGTLLLRLSTVRTSSEMVATPYPDNVLCLDTLLREHGWSRGISTYWLAKHTSLLSRAGVSVLAVSPQLQPHFLIGNRHWYQRQPAQFALVNDDEPAFRCNLTAGPSKEIGRCGLVSVYDLSPAAALP